MPAVEGVAMLQLRQAPLRRCGRGAAGWQSPVTIPRRWLAALFGCCALFAGGMALFSSDGLHRLWGVYALGGYLLAAVLAAAWKAPRSADLALPQQLQPLPAGDGGLRPAPGAVRPGPGD